MKRRAGPVDERGRPLTEPVRVDTPVVDNAAGITGGSALWRD